MIIMLRSEINAAGKNKGEYKTKIIKIKKPIYHSCERNEIRRTAWRWIGISSISDV